MIAGTALATMPVPTLGVRTDARPEPDAPDAARRYAELLEEAKFADDLGFRSFSTSEQHAVDDGHLSAQLTAIAGLATATTTIRFLTNAVLALLHPLRRIVEQATVVDLLSGGRVELGVAAAGHRHFDLLNMDMPGDTPLMDDVLLDLRGGLSDGELPDGPDGALLPVRPRPAQTHVPLYLSGRAQPVLDRAARFTDGAILAEAFQPEQELPRLWQEKLRPALEQHARALDDFRFTAATVIWASDDPERDWDSFYRDALKYQLHEDLEWAANWSTTATLAQPDVVDRTSVLIDTPENVASRLIALRERAPYHEIVFSYRLPHIGHERAMEHLETMADRVLPALQRAGRAQADAEREASRC